MWSSTAGGVCSVLAVLLVTASGCGADSADRESQRCEPLPVAAAAALRSVLKPGVELRDPVVVRSEGYPDPPLHMVAAVVDGAAALWAMTRLDGSGGIYASNDHAWSVSNVAYSNPVGGTAAEALSCV